MTPRIILLIFLLSLFSCTQKKGETENANLNQKQIDLIKDFAAKMTISINQYQYDFVRNAWDKNAFETKVVGLNEFEQSIFNRFYDKELSKNIENANIDLVNKLKYSNGKIILTNMKIFDNFVEATYSMIFDNGVDFCKYRIEIINEKPKLSDFYSFRDEIWQSQNVKNIIRLYSKHAQKKETYMSILYSEKALQMRDSLTALEYLYNIPPTNLTGNYLSIRKINLAQAINDSILAQVLVSEFEMNKSIYIKYLYSHYFNDSILLQEVFEKLGKEVGGNNSVLDSLKTSNYLWK